MKLHLPTRLRAAVIACMAVAVTLISKTTATDIISVNFGTTDLPTTATGDVGGVEVGGWMNIVGSNTAAVNGTHDLTNADKIKAGSLTLTAGSNPWGPKSASTDTLAHAIQSSYLDLSESNKWAITLSSDYLRSTAILYFSGDGNSYSPVTVNGTDYIGGTDTQAGSATSWGTRTNGVDFDDTNTITVTGNIGGTITMASVSENDAAKRATLAGLQIVDTTADILYTTVVSSTAVAADQTWTCGETSGKLENIAEADRYLGVTASGSDAVLTFSGQAIQALQLTSGALTVSGNVTTGTLFAKSGATLTFAGTFDGGGDLVIGGLGTVNLSGTQTVGNLTVGSGTLHLNSDAVITVNGSYNKSGDALTYDTGAKMFSLAEANKDYVSGGVTINSDKAFTADLLSTTGVDAQFSENATLTIASTGGSVTFNKAAAATDDITLTSTSLSATSGSTVIAAGDGVTLNTTLGGLSLDSSQTLELGSGVNMTLTDTGNSINLGNATLRVNGGTLTAEGLIMQNDWIRTSHFIIDDGLVEITGSSAAGYKTGSVRLAHWNGTSTDLVVNGGELRILNTSVGMGDDGQATFKVTGGVANIKGFRQVSGAKIQMTGGTLNIGQAGIWNTSGTQEFTGGTLGTLSANGWTSTVAMTISGATIQTNVYDVETASLTDTGANITLSDTVTASGDGIILDGSGSLTLGKTVEGTINIADGSTAVVKVASLDNLSAVAIAYTGYVDDQNGFATTERRLMNLATGQTTNVTSVLVGEETKTVTDGVIDGSESTDNDTFLVNTTVDTSLMEDITGKNLTINAGSTLSVTTDFAVTGTLTMAATDATVTIAEGKTFDVTGDSALKQENLRRLLGSATGEGTLKVNGAEINSGGNTYTTNITGNIDIQGTLITNGWYAATTYNVLEGGAVTLSNTLTNQRVTWNVNGGDLTAAHITLGHSENSGQYPGFLTLSAGTVKTGDLKFINPQGTSGFTMTGGTLEFTQNDSSAFDISNSSAGTFTISGGTLKADTSSWYIDTTHAYSVGGVAVETTEGHTIELKNATVIGTITNSGSLSLTGTTNVTLSDEALVNYDKTLDSSGGTAPEAGTNGWMTGAKYVYTVVKDNGELAAENLVGSDNRTVELSGDDYVYVGNTIDSLYVIQAEGTTTLSDLIAGDFSTAQADIVLVKDGSTLDLTSDTAATFKLTGDGAAIAKGITLNGATLSTEWAGNVIVQNSSFAGGNLSTFVNGTKSTLTINGTSGYLADGAIVTANVILGENGWSVSDGYTNNDAEKLQFTVAGKLSGEGALNITKGNANGSSLMRYDITGDVSAWTGDFIISATGTGLRDKVVNFNGNTGSSEEAASAVEIANGIKVTGTGGLRVTISNDTDTVMKGAISQGNGKITLTTAGKGEKAFKGDITATSLTANSATVMQGIDTVLTSMDGTGSVTVNGGSLQVGSIADGLTTTVNDATLAAATGITSAITGATINGATIATLGTGAITLSGVTVNKGIDNTVVTDTNTGALTLAGDITVDVSATSALTPWTGEGTGYSEGDNGYKMNESGLVLVTGAATLADGLTINGKAAADALKVITDAETPANNKIVLLTGSTPVKDVYYVNTTVSTASGDAAEATSFDIATGATLTLASAKDLTLSGAGTVTTADAATYGAMTLTGATGNTLTLTGVAGATHNGTLTIAGTAPSLSGTFAFDATATGYTSATPSTESWSDTTNSQGFVLQTGGSVYLIEGATSDSATVTCGTKVVTKVENGYTIAVGTVVKDGEYQILNADTTIATITDKATELGLTSYTISIADGRTLDATAADYTGEGKLTPLLDMVSGDGTLKLTGGQYVVGSDQTLAFSGTDFDFTGDTQLNSWHAESVSTISIDSGSTVSVEGALQIQSKAEVKVAADSELTTSGNITLGHSLTGNPGYLTISGGTVETTGIARTNTGDTAESSVTMTDGTLTITSANTDAINSVTASLSGGTLDASQAAWGLTGTNVTVGGVTIAGANKLTLNGVNINGTITNAGTAELAGAISVSGITADSSKVDTYSDGASGFAQKTTTYTVISGGTNTLATGVTATDTQITGGASSFKVADNGNIVMETVTDKDTSIYYVNSNVTTGSDDSVAATSFELTEGNTLTIADAKTTTKLSGTGSIALTTDGSVGALTLADNAEISGADLTTTSVALGKDATLSLTGALSTGTLTLGNLSTTESYVSAGSLTGTSLNIVVTDDMLALLNDGTGASATVLTLGVATATSLKLNGTDTSVTEIQGDGYSYKLALDGNNIVIKSTVLGSVWEGTGDEKWGDGGSWSGGVVPSGDDSQANFTGKGNGTVTIADAGVSVDKIVVSVEAGSATDAYTFTGGMASVEKALSVDAGTLNIGNKTSVADKTALSGTGALHINVNGMLYSTNLDATGMEITADKATGSSQTNGTLAVQKGTLGAMKGGTLHVLDEPVTLGTTIAAADSLVLEGASTLDEVINDGNLITEDTLTVNGNLTNNGVAQADKAVQVDGTLANNADAVMTVGSEAAPTTLTVGTDTAAGTLTNAGTLTVYNTITVKGPNDAYGALTNTGTLMANGLVTAGSVTVNGGTLTANNGLSADKLTTQVGSTTKVSGAALSTYDSVNNAGTLITDSLETEDLTNTGTLRVSGQVQAGSVKADGGELTANGLVKAESVAVNGGTLKATNGLTTATLTTEAGTTTTVSGAPLSATTSVANAGTLNADELTTPDLTNNGTLKAGSIGNGTDSIEVTNDGTLTTGTIGKVDTLSVGDVSRMEVTGGNLTANKIEAGSDAYVGASGTLAAGTISAADAWLSADTLDVSSTTGNAQIGTLSVNTIAGVKSFDSLTVEQLESLDGSGTVAVDVDDASLDAMATTLASSLGSHSIITYGNTDETDIEVNSADMTALNNLLEARDLYKVVDNGDGTLSVSDNSAEKVLTTTGNGTAGLNLMTEALRASQGTLTGDLADVMDSIRTMRDAGNSAAAQKLGEALSGASIAAMGAALSGDMDRQLRAIRNRTTTMGVNQSEVNEDMPYFNAWVNAEGDYRKMNADNSLTGYEMSSWGGTVGFDADCTPNLTCGLALTAMYGDFKSKGADQAEGDLDTYYVTAFARYAKHRWTNTFVASVGLADTSLDRTVNGSNVTGDSDGMMFGALYELGYVIPMDKDGDTCLQPIVNVAFRHTTLNGYTETGSNIALKADDVEMTTVTFGAGARLQSVIGENLYNRSSILELRALVKADAGDRQAEADMAFAGTNIAPVKVKGAEAGAVGGEFGVGLTIPVAQEGGSIFMDASAEIRADYSNVNATIGYRVNF